MVKIEEWSSADIAQGVSFTHMINKINDNFDREGRQFSFSKCVTSC